MVSRRPREWELVLVASHLYTANQEHRIKVHRGSCQLPGPSSTTVACWRTRGPVFCSSLLAAPDTASSEVLHPSADTWHTRHRVMMSCCWRERRRGESDAQCATTATFVTNVQGVQRKPKHETIEMTTRIAMLESGRVADWFATGRFHGLGIGRRLSYPILTSASILFPIAPSQGRSQEWKAGGW